MDNGLQYAGKAGPGQALTGSLDFYTIRTTLNISTGNFGTTSQNRLDALLRVVSMRGQPVILGGVTTSLYDSATLGDIPAASDGDTIYVIRFSIEHADSWANAVPSLPASLNGVAGFVYTTPTTANNVSVAVNAVL